MADLHCDFCYIHTEEMTDCIEYPAQTFPTAFGSSIGNWMACSPCSKLVEVKDWPALLKRVEENDESYRTLSSTEKQYLHSHLLGLWNQFIIHRTGEGRPHSNKRERVQN
jgi:hypothetical protein